MFKTWNKILRWCKGEPNNPKLEHCALLYNYFYMGSFKMCLNDISCGFRFNYVCEYCKFMLDLKMFIFIFIY